MSEQKVVTKKTAAKAEKHLAVILVRGRIGMRKDMVDTLTHMRLGKKHTCSIIADNESSRGMCKKVHGYVAWGEIDVATISALAKAKGEGTLYHLAPPRKGFPRKGIKVGVNKGGTLGYWGPRIKELITRMI